MTKENQTQQPVSGAMTDEWVLSVMFEIFEYARISDGIDSAIGDSRKEQRENMAKQIEKLRAILSRAQDAQAVRNAALIDMSNALKEIDHITQAAHEGGYGAEGNLKALKSITRFAQTWLKHSDAICALQSAHAQPVERPDAVEDESEWRRLALQFDGHRMQALTHLRAMLQDPTKHAPIATAFLSEGSLSGEEVLAQRIAAIAANQPQQVRGKDAEYVELPPLPQAKHWWEPTFESNLPSSLSCWSHNAGPHPDWAVTDYFNADQMRDYALAAIAANQPQQNRVINEAVSTPSDTPYVADRWVRGNAQEPVAWFTEDHLTDKSATTWDKEVAERWRAKGWPVGALAYAAAPQSDAQQSEKGGA